MKTVIFLVSIIAMVVGIAWSDAIDKSDGGCDPGEDCRGCPFPCEKRRDDSDGN